MSVGHAGDLVEPVGDVGDERLLRRWEGSDEFGHPVVGSGGVHGDGADREEFIPGAEQFFEEGFRVGADLPEHEFAFQVAGLFREVGDQVDLSAGQCGHDRGGQLERCLRVQPAVLDPFPDLFGVQGSDRWVDRGVQRAVHGDQVVRAEELVEFHVVHVAVGADLRGVQHREDVVVVHVEFADVVAFQAVSDGDVVEPESFRQHHRGFPVTPRDVHPDQRIRLPEQAAEFLHRHRVSPRTGDHVHVHAVLCICRGVAAPP